jgi:peptide/nickel transport system permease protein
LREEKISMKWYIAKRLLQLIPVLVGVAVISFSLIHLAPGDPARTIAGEHASEQTIETLRVKYGLDKPIHVQFWVWFKQVLRGDFGRSIVSNEYVTREILDRFPNTVELAFFSMLIAIIVGFIAGVVSASKQYSVLDYTTMGVALFGVSMPVFWLGIMLMMIFGVFFRVLPIGGRISSAISFQRITGLYILDSLIKGNWVALGSTLKYLILPSVALATIPMATIARVTRSSMLEVLRQDYIRTERAKGLSERVVIYKHAVRNAMLPVITVIGLNFGLLLAGALLTETVFAWPGIGRYVVKAVQMRDYPVVQGCVLFFSFMFVIVNLITDLLYVLIDPRIKYR